MRNSVILLLLFFGLSLRTYCQINIQITQKSCVEILDKYSDSWKLDSNGITGLRELLATKFLVECKFVGLRWDSIAGFLGKPNITQNLDGLMHYKYRLNYYGDDISGIGTMLLNIMVDKKGIIQRFKLYEIDG